MIKKFILNTEVGLLGLWDSKALSFVSSKDIYLQNFVNEKDMISLMNRTKSYFFSTGGDGHFSIELRVDGEISTEEKELTVDSDLNIEFNVVSGSIYIGSPEAAGLEPKDIRQVFVAPLQMPTGSYSLSVYFIYDKEKIEKNIAYSDYILILKSHTKGQKAVKFKTLS